MRQRCGTKADDQYRRWWLIVVAALISTGMLAAAAASVIALVDLLVVFALVGAAVMLVARHVHLAVGHRVGGREILMGAVAAGTLAGTISGLSTIMGTAAVAVGLVILIASPWVVGADWAWMDCDVDTLLWGLCYSPTVPLRFQRPRDATSASDVDASTINGDERHE